MTTRSTSIAAFKATRPLQATQAGMILAILKDAGTPMTRLQLSARSGVDRGLTYSRVGVLIERGEVTELPDKAPCPISGRDVFWVQAANRQGELELAA